MNALHSPLDALAFDYATFGFFTLVNNHWTWFALLTAAFSLWKIRAKPHSPPPPTPPPPPSTDKKLDGCPSTGDEPPVGKIFLYETPTGTSADVFSAGDGLIKGKFTVYYEEDRECEPYEEVTEAEAETAAFCHGGCGCKSEWSEKWDKMLEFRMGVKGWYMNQDLTDLNGNVVRFWD
ncbi:hypothetical protein QN277_027032 [Acacia crassicarpa]|uniref:Uncharacterized protein n=1 Tax=Acacia crassicarpa TaxID=499986 RepID=A0AAE1K5C1_9FABA|nr:hypothetical protein QN277_027032 [Acacia crassicarpa]